MQRWHSRPTVALQGVVRLTIDEYKIDAIIGI
jgi:hypothetical protein